MVLLPTRSSTASSCLASAIRVESSGPSVSTRCAQLLEQGDALTAPRGGDDPHARVHRHGERGLAERGGRAPYDQCLSSDDFQITEQAGPSGRIGFRDRSQLGPGQLRLDQGDVRRPHSSVFGIAAIDGAPEAPHQRGDLGADGKLAAGAGVHQPDALDPDHVRRLGPLASAHVHLGVIEAERFDCDHDMASQRLRQIRIDQAVEAAELF
jgi:hypothetical protein